MFEQEPVQRQMQACLRTCAAPRPARLRQSACLRNVTAPVLRQMVQPFVLAAQRRGALTAWLDAVTKTGGTSSSSYPLPAELLTKGRLNPTVTALVVAVGQQLDLVDSAVQETQVRAAPCRAFVHHADACSAIAVPARWALAWQACKRMQRRRTMSVDPV